jgi:hypothetical protein
MFKDSTANPAYFFRLFHDAMYFQRPVILRRIHNGKNLMGLRDDFKDGNIDQVDLELSFNSKLSRTDIGGHVGHWRQKAKLICQERN